MAWLRPLRLGAFPGAREAAAAAGVRRRRPPLRAPVAAKAKGGPPPGPPRLLCSPAAAAAEPALLSSEPWDDTVILIDKRLGWTSFDVVAKLRGALKRRTGKKKLKVGHAGTLDPLASGLLVVCVGKATKRIDSFVGQEKRYVGTARLGESTPSLDRETQVDETAEWAALSDEQLATAAQELTGELAQLPPMYSALHVGGERLYEKARRGETVEVEPRNVTVHSARVWRAAGGMDGAPTAAATASEGEEGDEAYLAAAAAGQDVHFELACSKGTYVRSWARDFGERLGTVSHLAALRRTAIGELAVPDGPEMRLMAEPAGGEGAAVPTGAWDVEELVEIVRELNREADAAADAAAAGGGAVHAAA